MLFRAFAAATISCASAASGPAPESMVFPNYPLVHRVDCVEGRGTAFRIGANHWLSVAHVTSLHECTIDGEPISIVQQDGPHDFSRVDTDEGAPNGFKVNCSGFIPGHWYWAIGYALGAPFQTAVAVYATYAKSPKGERVLLGPHAFIPGMSGGPVVDENGAVVGTVNAFVPESPISLSRELKDTSICGADIA